MGFSALADMNRRIPHGNRQSRRTKKITGVMLHHNEGVDSYGEATNPSRVVSANYWPTSTGAILPQIDEDMRAWTSGAAGYPNGAQADHCMVTMEISNAPGFRTSKPRGAITAATYASVVALIGDIFHRRNLGAVRRGWMSGVMVHQDVVATDCPGDWIMANLPRIITDSERVRLALSGETPPAPSTGRTIVKNHYHRQDAAARKGDRVVEPGKGFYLLTRVSPSTGHASNIVGGVGPYTITEHVYATGTPGDVVDLTLVWQDTKARPVKNSRHYVERVVIGPDGTARHSVTSQRAVPLGYAVYCRLDAPATNQGAVKVTVLDTDAYLYATA